MSYPYVKNTLLALGILVLSFGISFARGPNIFSILGGVLGFLIFSYNFRKIVGPIIFLIIFLLPIALSPVSFLRKASLSFMRFRSPFISREVELSHPDLPVSFIPSAKRIKISGPGFIIKFDKDKGDIGVPEGVRVERVGDILTIEAPTFYNGISFFKLYGRARAKEIVIGAKSQIDDVSIDAMGVKIMGYINAKRLSIDSMGADIEGILDLEELEIDGMGIKLHSSVIRAPSILIDGMGADINLKYTTPWEGTWILSVDGLGTKIRYTLPPGNPGKLDIKREGFGNVVERYGD